MIELQLYADYLNDLERTFPQDVEMMRAVFNAFDAMQAGTPVTWKLLQPIMTAASDSRKLIFDVPTGYLNRLSCQHAEAREAVAKMADDPNAFTRVNAIMCIGNGAPLDFKVKLLRQGLGDKSSKVRQKSADWTGRLCLTQLVPELERAVAAEENAKAKAAMEYALNCLKGGYTVRQEADGTVAITKFSHNGGTTRWCEQDELDRRGMEALLAEFPPDKKA